MDPMIPEPCKVHAVKKESRDTVTLRLQPIRPNIEFSFAAGQFNMIYVFGVGEVPISMSSRDLKSLGMTHTVRAVGAVSRAITRLKPGSVVGVRGPFGSGWPVETAAGDDVILMAGGIGIAPLRPAIQDILSQRSSYRRVALLYGARQPADLLYENELRRWAKRFNLQVEIAVDSAGRDWRGQVGVVTGLLPKIEFDPDHVTAMICGPEIMMRFAVRELRQRGIADERLYLSMERNMKCAVGFCGHCQFGPAFICKDGPVFRYSQIGSWFETREI